MCKVLIIEEDAPTVRLLAWALDDSVGYEVIPSVRLSDSADAGAAKPDYILINTRMDVADKRGYVDSLRYLLPDVSIVDLRTSDNDDRDTGADAYIYPPYLETLFTTLERLAAAKQGRTS